MTYTPTQSPRLETLPAQHRSLSLMTAAMGVVLAVLVGLGAGFLIGTATSGPAGLADDAVVKVIDDNIRAIVDRDAEALAATFTDDAVMTDQISGSTWRGASKIAQVYTSVGIADLTRTSDVVGSGRFYTSSFTYYGGRGITVWHIVDGLIAHQWVIGR